MKYARLGVDRDGGSRLAEMTADVAPVDFIPGQPALDLGVPEACQTMTVIRTPAGWDGGWHPSPRRQYVVGTSGELEFRTTDGSTCRVTPGTIVLLEDTTGTGHHTRVVGAQDWWGLLIGLD